MISENVERAVVSRYYSGYVMPELLSSFETMWIECTTENGGWSERVIAKTHRFPHSSTIKVVDGARVLFPCMRGEVEFCAILFGDPSKRGSMNTGYARSWKTYDAEPAFWKLWYDWMIHMETRSMVRYKTVSWFRDMGGVKVTKKRKVD